MLDAASHAEVDPMRGVSESIIIGQLPRMGTGKFKFHIHIFFFQNNLHFICTGSFDLLLDAEKAKSGIEIPKYGNDSGNNLFYAAGTPPVSPIMTPWNSSSPFYQNSWSSSEEL